MPYYLVFGGLENAIFLVCGVSKMQFFQKCQCRCNFLYVQIQAVLAQRSSFGHFSIRGQSFGFFIQILAISDQLWSFLYEGVIFGMGGNDICCIWGSLKRNFLQVGVSKMPLFGMWLQIMSFYVCGGLKNAFFHTLYASAIPLSDHIVTERKN